MKEIGSEFWEVPLTADNNCKDFLKKATWYLSGRSALNAIIDSIQKKKRCMTAALPSWCCDSIIKPFLNHDIEVKFYPVYLDENNKLIQDVNVTGKCDITLIMDFFGFKNLFYDTKIDGIVIRDLTHSVFSGIPEDANYYFGSLRKWAGFWTGGFAWSNDEKLQLLEQVNELHKYVVTRKSAMQLKKNYIEDVSSDKQYLSLFSWAENWLEDNDEVLGGTIRDSLIAEKLNIDYIRSRRRSNAEYLLKRLEKYSFVSKVSDNDCPLFVPLFFSNDVRDGLRRHLIENDIYCPVHWPITEYHQLSNEAQIIYQKELSVICDQRYDLKDMARICDCIEDFI